MSSNPNLPRDSSLGEEAWIEGEAEPQRVGTIARGLHVALVMAAAIAFVAVLSYRAHSVATTDPGQANIGTGLATIAAVPSLFALGLSVAGWRVRKSRTRVVISLIAAILLTPAVLLFLLAEI